MHDPFVVAFEIKRPWPNRRDARGWRYWPPMLVVWHREPGGHDSGEVCRHYDRVQQPDGTWKTKVRLAWKLHIHHWHIQVPALQELRRRLLTRCAWCGGRSTKRDAVNISHSWDGPRGRWWQGAPGLYHHDCSSVSTAHAGCLCEEPICRDRSAQYGPYGDCAQCGKMRAFGVTPQTLYVRRILATIPPGRRDPVIYANATAASRCEATA